MFARLICPLLTLDLAVQEVERASKTPQKRALLQLNFPPFFYESFPFLPSFLALARLLFPFVWIVEGIVMCTTG